MPLIRPVSSNFLLVFVIAALPAAAATPRGQTPPPGPALVEHRVARGETLWSISQKHRTSVGAIMDYNHLPDHNVREGMLLRIPPNVVESTPGPPRHVHVVKRGEDFWHIAEHYEVPAPVLAKANPNINPNRLQAGTELFIPLEQGDRSRQRAEPAPRPQAAPAPMLQHTVGNTETFYSIGHRYGVSTEAMVAANPQVRPERLREGMKVFVPTKSAPAQPQPKPVENASRSRGRTHVIKENESIATIARMYGVSEAALLRENELAEDDPIYVDDVLRVPGGASALVVAASAPTKTSSVPPKSVPAASAPPPKPSAPVPSNTVGSDGVIRSYIVSAGEDENTICEAFGISKQALFDHNHLSPTTRLKPGDEIAIPRVSRGRKH